MSFARVRGPGQPDQACDLVAAAVVEEYVRRDPAALLNVRVSGGRGVLFVAGDVQSSADFDVSAVARRALGQAGVSAALEPFIAFEPMSKGWAVEPGSRETVSLIGYATSENAERLPPAVALARDLARALERRRTSDPEWFWLGSDYEVTVEWRSGKPLATVRAEHASTTSVSVVRELITSALMERRPEVDVRVNMAGEEAVAGLAHRMGSSGRAGSAELYGSGLPAHASGSGMHVSHPLNAGAWLLRQAVRELAAAGKGKAIMIQATWLAADAIPSSLRIRNERGENLAGLLPASRFDLSKLPPDWRAASLGPAALSAPYDGTVALPWEN